MKLSGAQIDRFVAAPDPAVRLALLYGPDGGLVAERADRLLRNLVDAPDDPFRVAELSPERVREDPALLRDEAGALALGGGRRVVRLRGAGDGLAEAVAGFLDAPAGDSVLIVEAGDLAARSALRKLAEGAAGAAALPCYRDDEKSLAGLIRDSLAGAGFGVEGDALAFLTGHLGGDRQVTRRELEKLLLYMEGRAPGTRATLEDARACVGDSAELTLDDLALAVAGGDLVTMERTQARAFAEGAAAVTVLRAVARHFQRLHQVAGRTARGATLDAAVKALKPPLFWKTAPAFRVQAESWSPAALAQALGRLLEVEIQCKRTAAPARLLTERLLLELTSRAPTRRRQRR